MRKEINTYSKIAPNADIKIQPFDISKRYTKPHRHNKYLELVYFTEGSGFHVMDEKEYTIEPPVVFIIKTEWDSSIEGLFEIACHEIKLNNQVKDVVIEGVVKALLSKILGYATIVDNHMLKDVVVQFNELLESEPKNDIAYFAQLLNTTAQNLNTQCRREYNKTASEVIAGQIVKEAQRLLRYTELTVTEIAFKFDFKDVSHFVKYFKRHQGVTPKQFKTGIIP